MNKIKDICWKIIQSIYITASILLMIPLVGLLWRNTYIDTLKLIRSILGEDFINFIIHNILGLLTITMILVFKHSITEKNFYKKLQEGINKLANGEYNTRLSYNKYSSLEYRNLIRDFNVMAQELASTETLQKNFMNDVSHEFKTPISSIKGFAKILEKGYVFDEEGKEYLDIIIQESNRLTKLSENVLLLCKLEEQVLVRECETFNISDQIRKSILILQKEWESKNIEIDIDIMEVQFKGNPALLQQVWLNLISNSIKFSSQNSVISVRVHQQDKIIKVSIKDYGVGIDGAELPHIFKRFYRVAHEENTGNGIGLSIVKRVIELHQGEINVTSIVGEGTTFEIKLVQSLL